MTCSLVFARPVPGLEQSPAEAPIVFVLGHPNDNFCLFRASLRCLPPNLVPTSRSGIFSPGFFIQNCFPYCDFLPTYSKALVPLPPFSPPTTILCPLSQSVDAVIIRPLAVIGTRAPILPPECLFKCRPFFVGETTNKGPDFLAGNKMRLNKKVFFKELLRFEELTVNSL